MLDRRTVIRKLIHLGIVFGGSYLFYLLIALNFDFLFQSIGYIEPYMKDNELLILKSNLTGVIIIYVIVELSTYFKTFIKKPLMVLDNYSKLKSVADENKKDVSWIVFVLVTLFIVALLFKSKDWPLLLLHTISSSVALPALFRLSKPYLMFYEDKIQYGGKEYLAYEITDVEECDAEGNEEVVFSFNINNLAYQLNIPLHLRNAVSDHLKRLAENTLRPLNTFEEVPDIIAKPR